MRRDRATEVIVGFIEQAADKGIPMFAMYASDDNEWHFAGQKVDPVLLIKLLRETIKELETTPLSEHRTLN